MNKFYFLLRKILLENVKFIKFLKKIHLKLLIEKNLNFYQKYLRFII